MSAGLATAPDIPPEALAVLERLRQIRNAQERQKRAHLQEVWLRQAADYRRPGALAAAVRLLWPVVETRPLEWAPYLDLLCHALQRQALGDAEYRKLCINIPPGFAKSLLVSVIAPCWEWTFDPTRRKLFFSGDDSLSKRDSRKARQVMQSPAYQRLLRMVCEREGRKPWTFAGDQNEKVNFENSDRGFRQCLTLRAGVTGKRGDDIAIDDPVDVKAVILGGPDAILRRCREANQIIAQALQTRVNDLRDARQTLIMQRLHPEDPAGVAIRDGDWHVVCLPLHYDPGHPQAHPDDPRTEPGELLHPDRAPEALVADLASKLGQAQAEAQLEQRPSAASGGRIKREWFRERYQGTPEQMAQAATEVWLSTDTGKKRGPDSDFSVIQCWARRADGRRYLLDRRAERVNYPDFELMLDGMVSKWAAWLRQRGGVLVEDTAHGSTYLQVKGSSEQGVPLIGFHPSKDTPGKDKSKDARATYLERAAEAGMVVLPEPAAAPWVEDVLSWWCAFPMGAHDDDVDTASQLMMRWTLEEAGGEDPAALLSVVY